MATRHVVAKVGEIAVGDRKVVTVKGRDLGIFNVGGEFFALLNSCPHAGAPLCHGNVVGLAQADQPGSYRLSRQGEFLRCPWHGWEFDIRTGQSWCDPKSTFVKRYQVAVEQGEAIVKGPYVASTFEVTVDGEYLIVDF